MGNPITSGGSGGMKNVDFNLASLSGAIAPDIWLNAFMQGSLSASMEEKSVGGIDAGVPVLTKMVSDSQLVEALTSGAILTMLKGWADSLAKEAEIVKRQREQAAYDPTLGASSIEKAGSSASELKEHAYVQKINTIDMGSDGDKVFLASHRPTAASLDGTNLDARYAFLVGLKVMVDNAVSQLEKSSVTSAAPLAAFAPPSGVSAIDSAPAQKSKAYSEALMVSSVILAGAVAMATPVVSNGLHTESQVILGTWNALIPTVKAGDPATMLAGWFSAMWGMGQLYQLSGEKIEKYQGEKHTTKRDVDFAKSYAERLAGSLQRPEFAAQMLNLIASATQNAPEVAGKDPAHLTAMAKIALLSTALALILKAEEGVANEWNFKGVLTGEVDLTINDPHQTASIKRMLSQQIHDLLDGLPQADRDSILLNLVAYMSQRPSVEKLLDQQALFYETLNPPSVEKEIALHQISGE